MPEGDIIENDAGERRILRGGQWVPFDGQAPQQPSGSFTIPARRNPLEDRREARAERGDQREDIRLRLAMDAADRARAKEDAAQDPNRTYQERYDRVRADKDIARIEQAAEGVRMGAAMADSAEQADYWLDRGAPTGPNAETRQWLGQTVGGVLGFLPGIPDTDETNALRNFSRVTSGMALDNVGKLKGPLSDKDIAFLKATVADADASPQSNREAIAAQRWAAQRAIQYERGLQAWTQRLGRPSALNDRGLSYDAWWAQWAAENIPPPGAPRRAPAPKPAPRRDGGRAALSAVQGNARMFEELARRSPRRQTGPKPLEQMSDDELRAIAEGRR